MRIAMGADHAGFEMKAQLIEALRRDGHDVVDLGTDGPAPVDYPDYAAAVGRAVLEDLAERGILLCGSGVGASVAANKLRGIRAGLCHDTYSAHQGVEHDDMNLLVLGARVVGIASALELSRAFVAAVFTGEERHVRRLRKVAALDARGESTTEKDTAMNPLQVLGTYDQSVWLDYIRRHLVTSGELQRLVDEDGVTGVTSNPAIFEKAIAGSTDYTESLVRHAGAGACDPKALYEALAIEDIQLAADVLHPVYARTAGRDGYVSLEVAPDLAHDTAGTVEEARRLWGAVGRENLMIKVPATPAGIPAIRQVISESLNVNVTLLFSVETYERVAEAYMAGLEDLAARGGDLSRVASVASFFISRIDSVIDARLTAKAQAAASDAERDRLLALTGRAAIANARLAYRRSALLFQGARWEALAARGARPQRLLWASTGTKNPAYRDTLYVEDLIGPNTVNTIPPATLDAFRDHGRPRASLAEDPEAAAAVMAEIAAAGISMPEVADRLLTDGVQLFADAFRTLLKAVAERHGALRGAEGVR